MRTITQVADELGVSRKKIYNEIERLKITTKKESKNNYIEDNDFIIIKNGIQEKMEHSSNCAKERLGNVIERDRNVTGNGVSDREYNDLKERIVSLEEQIKIKDEQLQAKDYQINGLIQSNVNMTKFLNPPYDETAATTIVPEGKKSFWSKIFGK
jgi:hypothetical protein